MESHTDNNCVDEGGRAGQTLVFPVMSLPSMVSRWNDKSTSWSVMKVCPCEMPKKTHR